MDHHHLAILFKVYPSGAIAILKLPRETSNGHLWVGIYTIARFCVGQLSCKNILFVTFNRSVSNAPIFFAKYMLAMVPTKGYRKSLKKLIHFYIKLRPPITWLIDIMRQTLKCTQGKQIFSILYHIICDWKMFTGINQFKRSWNYISYTSVSLLIFVLLSYLLSRQFHGRSAI